MIQTAYVCAECGARADHAGTCPADGQALRETTDPMLGSELGRYRLARVLGEGGMGTVYLGVQPAIGSRVAVKVLSDACASEPDLVERFFAEAKAVNLIRHENIVNVLDMARLPNNRPYIVMEFVGGRTLAAVLAEGRPALGGVVQVMDEVLSALGAAHAIGIIHRDLKPENILITAEGHAKVLDFGVAKLAPGLQHDRSPRTQTGALLGTPAYMAPEQISGNGTIDARADLYAAGIVLFEAVCGVAPFRGEMLFDLMRAHVEQPPPRPRDLRPDLSPAFEAVILTALAKDPAARFPTAAAMAHALLEAGTALPVDQRQALSLRAGKPIPRGSEATLLRPIDRSATIPASDANRREALIDRSATVPATPRPKRRKQRRWVLLASALIGAAIAVVAVLVNHHPTTVATTVATVASADAGPTPAAPPAPTTTPHEPPEPAGPPAPITPREPPAPTPARAPHEPARQTSQPPEPATPPPAVVTPPEPAVVQTPDSLAQPADYNPAKFDPVAYLPRAYALARKLMPDATLISFEFDPVFADGHVELTSGRDHEYRFRSPSRSKRPADRPSNVKVTLPCIVHIEVTPTELTAMTRTSDTCDERLVRHPHCTFAQLMTRAKDDRLISGNMVVRIGWLFDEKWFFDSDPDTLGKGGGVTSLADQCP